MLLLCSFDSSLLRLARLVPFTGPLTVRTSYLLPAMNLVKAHLNRTSREQQPLQSALDARAYATV